MSGTDVGFTVFSNFVGFIYIRFMQTNFLWRLPSIRNHQYGNVTRICRVPTIDWEIGVAWNFPHKLLYHTSPTWPTCLFAICNDDVAFCRQIFCAYCTMWCWFYLLMNVCAWLAPTFNSTSHYVIGVLFYIQICSIFTPARRILPKKLEIHI